ncbi:MAG: aminotransferase class III-fold pyridoxal phosphate-dependent enzyme, partial [Rickettsiales bacterium]|nr:aminotransferase class III-fold pyridoxal phosphate-dependent enzyme [Rickettsiales bacterium]
QFPEIIEVIRGVGYMIGIKISNNYLNTDIVSNALNQKLLTIPAGDNVIRLLPPLIITQKHIKEAIEKLAKALDNTSKKDSSKEYIKVGN